MKTMKDIKEPEKHHPMCNINLKCLVIHPDGVCPGPYGKCNCKSSTPSIPHDHQDGTTEQNRLDAVAQQEKKEVCRFYGDDCISCYPPKATPLQPLAWEESELKDYLDDLVRLYQARPAMYTEEEAREAIKAFVSKVEKEAEARGINKTIVFIDEKLHLARTIERTKVIVELKEKIENIGKGNTIYMFDAIEVKEKVLETLTSMEDK